MPDIALEVSVNAPMHQVFDAFVTASGLDAWWTLRSVAEPRVGGTFEFYFGEAYDWFGEVSCLDPGRLIEWTMTKADDDWAGTAVGASLRATADGTHVEFWHRGWKSANAHYHTTAQCWAIYLRLMKRWVETGDVVPYAQRLNA